MEGHDAFVAPATTTGKNVAPRVAALLDVMQISDVMSDRGRGYVHPPDLRRQRHRHGQIVRLQEGAHGARHRVRESGGRGRIGHDRGGRRAAATRACPASVGAEIAASERPELTSAKIIVSGGRAFGSSEQFHALHRSARRQARRRRSAPAAPRSTPAMRPTIIRSARPARSSPPKSISRSAFRARSSTSPE